MAEVAKVHQDRIENIKNEIEKSWEYYRPNFERFNFFRKFVFDSTLSEDDISLLQARKMPQIEFNICEAYVSRLLGEFSKQEPSITVSSDEGDNIDYKVMKVAEAHIRHILFDGNKNGADYEVYRDQLSGGFGTYKVYTEYANDRSFNIVIKYKRCDPIMCGFDVLASNPTKSDGRYCFEVYPKLFSELKETYPDITKDDFSFYRDQEGFNWSYRTQRNDEIVLVCDFYERKKKRVKIVKIASIDPKYNNRVMTMDEYKELLEDWNLTGKLAQAPAIIGKPRWSETSIIYRYVVCENKILEVEETNYKYLPLVYVPGNDVLIKDSSYGYVQQMTRPYVYNMKGAQQLKNFAGQNLANELENMVQHKWMAPLEAIPNEQEWLTAWTEPQHASVFVYNAYNNNDPNQPLPQPREIQRAAIPQEISQTFAMMDQLSQNILGSYDASLGINNNQLSGVAIVEGATQSNSAAMPYIVSNLLAKQQLAEIFIDLIPKCYVTPRTIPIRGLDGKNYFVNINGQDSIDFNYDENALQVKVEAGVNFQIQKNRALQQIIALQQASPMFAQFMNEMGLEVLLDNVEIYGGDHLKQMVSEWNKQQEAKKQQAMQMQQQAMMNNPQMIRAKTEQQRLQLEAQQNQQENQLKSAQLGIDKQQADTDRMKVFGELGIKSDSVTIQHEKAQAENTRSTVDLAMKEMDMRHRHQVENRTSM